MYINSSENCSTEPLSVLNGLPSTYVARFGERSPQHHQHLTFKRKQTSSEYKNATIFRSLTVANYNTRINGSPCVQSGGIKGNDLRKTNPHIQPL